MATDLPFFTSFEDLHSFTTISLQNDIELFIYTCVFALLYRLIMCELVLNRIAKVLHQKNILKFKHRTFDMIHYTTSAILGLISMTTVNYGKCFIFARDCLEHFKQNEDNEFVCTVMEKIYYFDFLSYYVVDIIYIFTNPDIFVLATHHFATISMVLLMVAIKMPAMGFSIMILHDVVDVPLYLGKVLYYLGSTFWKDICLVFFALGCTYFRIINLFMIVYITWILDTNHMNKYLPGWSSVAFWLLRVLFLLHLFWESKIVRTVYGILKSGNKIRDTRSDSE